MTGRYSSVVTRLQQASDPNMKRVWSALHQVDIEMRFIYENVLKRSFFSHVTALIAYFRRQLNLIGEIRSTCAKPACMLPAAWWMLAATVRRFSSTVSINFRALSLSTLVSQQRAHLAQLIESLLSQR
eukprot:IDg6214t1